MKRFINILKLILYFGLGYILFAVIISLIEFVFLNILSEEACHFGKLFLKSFKGNLSSYTITYLVIFILNLLYNLISIKILNAKLKNSRKDD